MELRYRREAAVGFMIIVGAVTFMFLMMWLRGTSLRRGDIVRVSFNDVAGLKVGDPVRTSGVRVGRVTDINLIGPGDVEVDFDVSHGPPPRTDASARILSQDFFGARFVDYSPGVARDPLPADRKLRGERIDDIAELTTALGARGKTLLDTLGIAAVSMTRELHATLRATQALLATLNSGAQGTSQRLEGAVDALRRSLQRVDVMLEQNGPTVGEALRGMRNASTSLDSLTRSLSRASAQFDSILTKVNSGRGPAAALLNDSSLVTELRQTNTALRDLLVDFKANPGRYIRLRL